MTFKGINYRAKKYLLRKRFFNNDVNAGRFVIYGIHFLN